MPRHLCIVRPTLDVGGADRVTLTLLRHLPRGLFRPSLVLIRQDGRLLSEVPEDVQIRFLPAGSLWTAWLPLARLVQRERPDILLSTSSGANIIAALAYLLSGRRGRLVLSERGMLRTELSWKKLIQSWLKRVLYPTADCITAVSQGVKDDLVQQLHLRPEAVTVIYNPVVDGRLDELAAEPVLEPWFADERPTILTAGRLVHEKDYSSLLTAFSHITEETDSRLAILGTGPLRSALEEQAEELGLGERIAFLGFEPNPFRFMSRCSVFALSSLYEGLPGVLIQAMACGAAVVSTDCPAGPSEIVSNGIDGILVPVGDPRELGNAIHRLLTDDSLRRQLGANARVSSRRFTTERSLPAFCQALLGTKELDEP